MNLIARLRESFWFVPALLCLVAAVLAETLITLDQQLGVVEGGVFFYRVGASGSRDLLGAVAGSMLAVAATTFSITLAVLATSSATYGPRLVRNFMADRGNQLVLGVFVSTFLYALMVLRSVRSSDDERSAFVPHLAVNVAVLLALVAIGVLVYFIHHISDSIQVATLARRVRVELHDCVERLYPDQLGADAREVAGDQEVAGDREAAGDGEVAGAPESAEPREAGDSVAAGGGVVVRAAGAGYVQGIDDARLMRAATEHDLVVSLSIRPGHYVVAGMQVAVVRPSARAGDEACRQVVECLHVAESRKPHQDVDFAVQQLEEMAVRALSPGTNDPYTAINALDDLSSGLTLMATRQTPSRHRYDDEGHLRVVAPRVALTDLVDRVFDAMRLYAIEHPSVLHHTLEVGERIADRSHDPAVHQRLRTNANLLVEAYSRSDPQEHDLDLLRRRAARLTGSSM